MDHCLSLHKSFPLISLPSSSSSSPKSKPYFSSFRKLPLTSRSASLVVLASTGASHCEFGSLNTPLDPKSSVGKHLSRVLQNYRHLFHVSVEDELKRLADDRHAALHRMLLAADSDEALLHRFVFSIYLMNFDRVVLFVIGFVRFRYMAALFLICWIL